MDYLDSEWELSETKTKDVIIITQKYFHNNHFVTNIFFNFLSWNAKYYCIYFLHLKNDFSCSNDII